MAPNKRKKKREARIPKVEAELIQERVPAAESSDFDITSLRAQQRELVDTIEGLRDSKLIVMVFKEGASLVDGICKPLYDQLRELGKQDRLDLFLSSRGGRTEVPLKVVTLLRSFGTHIGALVPYRAHSAATHVAIGANEIVMGDMSELSSVDPRRSHPLLPPDPRDPDKALMISVQDLRHCMAFVKKEAEKGLTPEGMVGVYQALFDKVHPLAVGAIEQSYDLSKQVTRKILQTYMDPENDKGKIEKLADLLSDHYKSHVLQIGWREAKEFLGLNVTYDNGELYELMIRLLELYEETFQAERAADIQIGGQRSRGFARPVVWLDTSAQTCWCEELLQKETTREGGVRENVIRHRWVEGDWPPQPPQESLGDEGSQS